MLLSAAIVDTASYGIANRIKVDNICLQLCVCNLFLPY